MRFISTLYVLASLFLTLSVQAQYLYWDTNGFDAGSGPGDTASGTWDTTTTNWSPFDGGNGSTQAWIQNRIAVFAAGSSATGNSTITLASSLDVAGITIEEGHFTFTGGSFTPRDADFNVYSGASATINATAVGVALTSGTGDVYATGAQTYYEGGFRVSTEGTLHVNLGTTDQVSINLLGTDDGGTLFIGSGTQLLVRSYAFIGGSSNESGTLTVDGNGTVVETTSSTSVGNATNDTGILNITNGGIYTSQGYLTLGNNATTSSGTINITGAGSSLIANNNPIRIGMQGTGTITVASGGTITANAGLLFGGSGGTGTLHLNSGGTLEVGGTDGISVGETGTANFDAAGGTLKVIGSDLTTSLDMVLADSTDTQVDTNSLNATLSGVLSGTGALTKSGTGNLTLSGSNTYSGGSTVSAGSLTGDTGSLQGDITNNAAVVFGQASTGTYAGAMSGSGSLTKTGAGNLTLSGTNTYSGGTTVSYGTLTVSSDANLGATSGALAVSGGATLNTGGYFGTNRSITLDGSGTNLTNNGELIIGNSGTGSLTLANGATVSAYNLDLGFPSGTGTVNISSGSSITATGNNGVVFYSPTSTINLNETGTLTTTGLSGTGNFNLAGGTLRSGAAYSSSTAATLTNASSVDTNGFNTTLSGAISGTGSLTKTGSGTLSLTGSNNYSGGTTVSAGSLSGNTGSLQGDITNNTAVIFDQASTGTYTGTMSGTGSLTKTGTGNLTLSGSNTYAGGTTVSNGTLSIASDANLGASSGSLAVSGGATLSTGNFFFNREATLDGSGTTLTTNNGELVVGYNGTGSLALTNDATASTYNLTLAYTGGTGTVDIYSGASLTVNNNTAFGTASSILNLNTGGTLVTGGITGGGTLNLAGGTLRSGSAYSSSHTATLTNASTVDTNGFNTTLSGVFSGTGSLTKSGAGNLTLSGANTYAGGTTVSTGSLTGNTTSLQGNITNNATVIFDQADAGSYSGTLSGTGSLTKTGVGNLTLSGTNTYAGGTTVSAGTLTLGSTSALGATSGNLTLNAGTLDLGTYSPTIGTVIFSGGTFTNGNLNNASAFEVQSGTLSASLGGSASLTKTGSGTFILTGTNTYTGTTSINTGTLVFGAPNALYNGGTAQWSKLSVASGASVGIDIIASGFNSTQISSLLNNATFASGTPGLEMYIADNYTLTQDLDLSTIDHAGAALTLSGDTPLTLDGHHLTLGGAADQSITVARELSGGHLGADNANGEGSAGGSAGSLYNTQGNLSFTQEVNLAGGNGGAGAGYYHNGGAGGGGGSLSLAGTSVSFAQAVNLLGGDGGTGESGANGGSGGKGGTGGTISLTDTSATFSQAVNLTGGNGGYGGNQTLVHIGYVGTGGTGGAGGTLSLAGSASATFMLTVNLAGGDAGNSDYNGDHGGNPEQGGRGGAGGTLSLAGTNASFAQTVNLAGGNGGGATAQGDGGDGGAGGTLIQAKGTAIFTEAVDFSGGNGAASTISKGGNGGAGGTLTISGGDVYFDQAVNGSGGAAGTSIVGSSGGNGGTVSISDGLANFGANASLNLSGALKGGNLGYNGAAGTLAISGGTLQLPNAGWLESAATFTGNFSFTGGTLKTTDAEESLALTGASKLGSALANAGVSAARTLDLAGDLSYSGVIAGSGAITKTGTGTLTLSGTNTYSGGTTVSAGTLTLGHASALGSSSSSVDVASGSTLNLNGFSATLSDLDGAGSINLGSATLTTGNADNHTLSGIIAGTGSLIKSGAGTLTLSGANTYSGGTTVSGGTLTGNTSSLQGNLTNNAAVIFDQVDGGTYAGVISGTGSLTKSGTGTLTLTGTNTHTGGTTVNAGTLQIGAGAASGSVSGGITNNGTVIFNRSDDYYHNDVISGTGGVTNDGYILRFTQAQTYTGATTVKSGGYLVLATNVDQGLSSSTTVHLESNAVLDISNHAQTIAGLTGSGRIYSFGGSAGHLTVNTAPGQDQVFSGQLGQGDPTFAFTKSGDGKLTLSGTNTYTGTTTVTGGTLAIGSGTSLATSSGIALSSGTTLDLSAHSSGYTVGAGQTLSGTGTVQLASGQALSIAGTLAPGNSPGTLTFSNDLTLESSAVINFEIGGLTRGTQYDAINIDGDGNLTFGGTLNLTLIDDFAPSSGDSFDLFDYTTATGTFDTLNLASLSEGLSWDTSGLYTTGVISVITSAVPEPSTYAVILGALALGFVAWRRRHRA